ncbi:MAG TPA: hypothetical protein VNO84_14700 [Burkholderiaceae bacterium]|nr:hypothetical protein [Burkholderiaceae bacterium]
MPTPNYAYEKRQRELAKKRKKEEKLKRRAEHRTEPTAEQAAAGAEAVDAPETPADEATEPERE